MLYLITQYSYIFEYLFFALENVQPNALIKIDSKKLFKLKKKLKTHIVFWKLTLKYRFTNVDIYTYK